MSRIIDHEAVRRGRDELSKLFHVDLPPLCCGPGWLPLIEAFLEEAGRCGEIRDLQITDIKEKYGTLIISHSGSQHLDDVVLDLEDRSAKVCMACGDPGQLRTNGWHRTLCDDCESRRRG